MKKCPSNKIYNPRSNRCIANNKPNVQKIIKECSKAYSKLQNKNRPIPKPAPKSAPKSAPKPAPKSAPKPKPAEKNNVCKINTKTARCSKSGTTDPHKCEVAQSGKCRIKKTSRKPTSKQSKSYNGFQKHIYNLKTAYIIKAFTNTSKAGKEFKKILKENKIKGTDLVERYKEPLKLSDHIKDIVKDKGISELSTLVNINAVLTQHLLKDLESLYVCNPKEHELNAKEKIVAKVTYKMLYNSISIKLNSLKHNLKVVDDWQNILNGVLEHSISGTHLVKCRTYEDFVKKKKLTFFAKSKFTPKRYKMLKDHVYGFVEDEDVKEATKTGNKKEALLVLDEVQKYIKAKNLDNSKSFKYFEGNRITIFAFLLSLLKRHKNDCVVIDLYANHDMISVTDNGGRFFNMKGLLKRVKGCAKRKKFAIMPIAIGPNGGTHANVIIYNPFTDTFEHFEPHGRQFYRTSEKTYRTKFRKKFEGTITKNTKYYPPMDIGCLLPPGYYGVGLQRESRLTGDLQGEELAIYKYAMTDPGGYCVAYSMYIADQRLAHPELSPDVVYLKAIQDASGQPYSIIYKDPTNIKYKRSIISFIRQYARTYLDVMRDCMSIFSEYMLMGNRKDLSATEQNIRHELYNKLMVNLKNKLILHSG
jgi:hypothetical protein